MRRAATCASIWTASVLDWAPTKFCVSGLYAHRLSPQNVLLFTPADQRQPGGRLGPVNLQPARAVQIQGHPLCPVLKI